MPTNPPLSHRFTAIAAIALIATATASAAGCDGGGRRASEGGTAVIVAAAGLDAFNPLVTGSAYTQDANRHLLFLPLLRYDRDLGLTSWLARSWELDGDSAAVFHLRTDVLWEDGVPTTAGDVVYTFRRAMDPETGYPNAGYFRRWQRVEALDSATVRVTFEPHPAPLAGVPLLPILPAHVLDTVPPAGLRTTTFNQRPVTNGPFRLASARPGDRWVFAANTGFPAELGGRPFLDRLVWRVVPEAQAQVTELLTGNAHLALEPPADRFDSLAARPDLRGIEKPSFRYSFIGWNGRRPPLGKAAIRVALTQALDRQAILAAARHGHGRLAIGPVPPAHPAFADDLAPIPFDPAAAARTLAEHGFRQRDNDPPLEDGRGVELAFRLLVPAGNDATRNLAQMVQAHLADVGVHVEIRLVDFATLVQTITGPERDFDAVLLALDSDLQLDLAGLFHSRAADGPFQIAGFANPRLDSLLDAVAVERDPGTADRLWHDIQALLLDQQPWTFLYYYPELVLADTTLQGVAMDLRGALQSAPGWWLSDGADL